jgi:phosphatidylserine/phosphatidylglycerophosphate/cardiolipin synthase-like enzyme
MNTAFTFKVEPFQANFEFEPEGPFAFDQEPFGWDPTDLEPEPEFPRGLPSSWIRRVLPKAPGTKLAKQPSCAVFLPANRSNNYEEYVAADTTGRITLLLNGRNSSAAKPDVAEAFDSMQQTVEALGPKDSILLAAWHFDPTVPLTKPGPMGVKTWGALFQRKAKEGVVIRIIMTDFAPVAAGLHAKLYNDFLPALDKLIGKLPNALRDNLKYIVSRHPATQVGIHVAVHHQKFMVVKYGGATVAYCGGLDIAYMRTPAYWTAANYRWLWHDLHAKLEGLITRDLEREFILRWNREKSGSVVSAQTGWKPFETLTQTPAGTADSQSGNNPQRLQMLRTVSVQGVGRNIQALTRDDIWQGYLKLVSCATSLLYMENQYFRVPGLADAIVKQAKAQPELIVIIVAPYQLDDPDYAIKLHGNWLQHQFFERLVKDIPAKRLGIYTMFNRIIHSKLIMVDDRALSVGSANVNPRGFRLDTELNVMLDDAEGVRSFRYRLWSHNLGVPGSTVAAWAVRDFIARWDAVAKANERLTKTPNKMAGEGVIPFNPLKEAGLSECL